jgi:3-hydroxyisobutyrate dehydrogenase-like beta-hydroxyacid dehydrogenase
MRCGVIGLGEAGRVYAEALVDAGHEVSGFDPHVRGVDGVREATDAADAVADAEIVLVLTAGRLSASIAGDLADVIPPGTVYVDMSSASPQEMQLLDARLGAASLLFADVAILGPVPLQGRATPLMVSGPGAGTAAQLLTSIGAPVEVVEGPGGQAMAHKLLRSVFMKGLAALVCETVEAGRAAHLEGWVRNQVAAQLAGDGHAVVERFLVGTPKHAVRRADEMRAVRSYLDELGCSHLMTDGTVAVLETFATEPVVHHA